MKLKEKISWLMGRVLRWSLFPTHCWKVIRGQRNMRGSVLMEVPAVFSQIADGGGINKKSKGVTGKSL